ncbi:MAG: rod shape-determining protein RodA [Candidatus Moraniibacteriota bacterium]
MKFNLSNILKIDWVLFFAVAFLTALGLLAIYSFSITFQGEGWSNFQKQLVFLGGGIFLFLFCFLVDYRIWKNYSKFLYGVGVLLLGAVLIFGVTVRGTSGWFDLGFANFQPVELMKVLLVIVLAGYLSRFSGRKVGLKGLVVSFLIMLIPVLLVLKQPDFGSAMVLAIIWIFMIFFAGIDKRVFFSLVLLAIAAFILSWSMFLKDYQKDRIEAFVNPQADPLRGGYNVIQSMVAIGSGGLTGKGIGYGSQSQLNFLPEKHTDFIFAAIAEESGFLGASLVLFFFGVFFYRLFKIALHSKDEFGKLLVMGFFGMFSFHVIVNIGMNLGVMPVAGLSLPFLSYGGSFLLVGFISLGLIMSVWKKRRRNNIAEDDLLV